MIYNMSRGPSSLYSNLLRRNTNAELQNKLAQAEQELATGVSTDIYKSLGQGASEALGLNAARDLDATQIAANTLLGGRIDSMSSALGTMRDSVQPVLALALANSQPGGSTASGLQVQAQGALDALISQANLTHSGMALFAGTSGSALALTPWTTQSSGTGQSPAATIAALLAPGLDTQADASARISELNALFDNADGSFDALFAPGSTDAPLQASIGDGEILRYGAQANDPAFREVLQGLVMLAATDVSEISDAEAYTEWMGTATALLGSGNEALLSSQIGLDAASSRIDAANTRMEDRALVYANRVNSLVGVDSYEAATNITALETQLQASYAVTARLSQLSFLNYMS
ncbi:flagellin [Marinovum sp. KMM 9879]